ncbi:MAG: hypothetical protein LBH01_07215 [Verrucomicrobiales bacterium]|jgi:fibronectin-binding autotransporter adhesin|nr:hypothetical protein [Verrucomicrobiales bacterium]
MSNLLPPAHLLRIAMLVLCIASAFSHTDAQTPIYWQNGIDGDWFVEGNWVGRSPTAYDQAIILNGTPYITTGQAQIQSAIISVGNLTVSGNGKLDIIGFPDYYNTAPIENGSLMIDRSGVVNIRDQAVVTTSFVLINYYSAYPPALNLQGGTIYTGGIVARSGYGAPPYVNILNSNGGTIVTTASPAQHNFQDNFFSGIGTIIISGSGLNSSASALTFDTNGLNITATNNFNFVSDKSGSYRAFEKIGSGTLTLSGNSDPASSKGDVYVNNGALSVTGSLRNDYSYIGENNTQSALGIIEGNGYWQTSYLKLGLSGNGQLILKDQATLVVGELWMGVNSSGSGSLNIASDKARIINYGGAAANINTNDGQGTVSFTHTGTLTMGNKMSGSHFTLNHDGTGTTILTGTLSYNGDTNVNAGTLLINGDASTVTTGINVKSGATFGGSGTVHGSQNIFSTGSRLTPGAENVVGSLTLNGFTMFNGQGLFDLASSVSYDHLLGGTVNITVNATITVNFLDGFDYQEGQLYSFDLMQGVTGDHLASIQWQNLSPQWSILQDSSLTFTDGTLTFQLLQIPEPHIWALLSLGSSFLLLFNRRQLGR